MASESQSDVDSAMDLYYCPHCGYQRKIWRGLEGLTWSCVGEGMGVPHPQVEMERESSA